MRTLGLGLSRDLVISREYGWLARQRYAVTRPLGSDAGQSSQPFRGTAVSPECMPLHGSHLSQSDSVELVLPEIRSVEFPVNRMVNETNGETNRFGSFIVKTRSFEPVRERTSQHVPGGNQASDCLRCGCLQLATG